MLLKEQIQIKKVKTTPFMDQKPGTSGLRKKVKTFLQQNYTANFIQSYFDALKKDALSPKNCLLVGGDGRYYSQEAVSIICRIACANGIDELHIARNFLMSTPACSAYIRELNYKQGNCLGGILLTASHNPGGINQDFGIKFNSRNGGPAQQDFTNLVYTQSTKITEYKIADQLLLQNINFQTVGEYDFLNVDRPHKYRFTVKIIQNVQGYVEMMKNYFEFDKIKTLLLRPDFNILIDSMHGAAGPYAQALFQNQFKGNITLMRCNPLPDFANIHPDPNLICAHDLVSALQVKTNKSTKYQFGAACDGDADRNMIVGSNFFVTPSDSLAVLVLHNSKITKQKIKGVARSMPTSKAVDRIAQNLEINIFQTPTGWKYFGNLMQEDLIQICGEQSFGTGSSHVREKDGLWTILAWLQLLAQLNSKTEIGHLIGVKDIVQDMWKRFGRNYYSRYDYQNCEIDKVQKLWDHIKNLQHTNFKNQVFNYIDPVDNCLVQNQGVVWSWPDTSRIIFRQSGTSSSGKTIRIYFEKFSQNYNRSTEQALKELVAFGLELSRIQEITGKKCPDIIT